MKSKAIFLIVPAFLFHILNKRRVLFFCFAMIIAFHGISQQKSTLKFGDVSEKDFATKVYSIDSNATAVILADVGSTEIEGNQKGWFSLRFKRYARVHILNKNGYDAANVSITLYTNGSAEENLDRLRAVTYNLENGKVVETKLDVKASVFKDKLDKYRVVKKFTLPNIKEGSIIEYEYTIVSDFLYNLQPWAFQGSYPCLWSEYNLTLPEFLGYVFLTQGYKTYDINERKTRRESYRVADNSGTEATRRDALDAEVTDYRWVMKTVPALKEESYTSTVNNHIAKIEFQLSEFRSPLQYQNIMGTWEQLAQNMMKSEYFGLQLNKDNGWLGDLTKPLVMGAGNKLQRAKNIFAFVRDHFTCTDHNESMMDQTLRNLVKTHNGTVSEINLLLIAMLKHEDVNADPVILSTRAHGYTSPIYPLRNRFNYVVAKTEIDGKEYLLDASEPLIGFGHIPSKCYNGLARVIGETAAPMELTPDSLLERKNSLIIIINDEKGNLVGSMQQTPGYYESVELRNQIKEKGQDDLLKSIKNAFGTEITITQPVIDSLTKYDYPLGIKYDFEIKEEKADILYLNPMFGEGYKENPFKSAERVYPVEMPYTMDENYTLQMEVPQGYVLDELPKAMVVKLNDQGDGIFEYRISESEGSISFISRIRFKRTYFLPEEYGSLREFFNLIVKKQNEQIVFKKKK
jgi:Domain of Unknown Function with PDB structure (DUF3857)/Domain of Unknown Function with PDB structure (DUF3858)